MVIYDSNDGATSSASDCDKDYIAFTNKILGCMFKLSACKIIYFECWKWIRVIGSSEIRAAYWSK